MTCSICLEDFKITKDKLKTCKDITFLTCDHAFHTKCLKNWFKYDKKYDTYSGSCPLCRRIGFDDSDFKKSPTIIYIIFYNFFRMIKSK